MSPNRTASLIAGALFFLVASVDAAVITVNSTFDLVAASDGRCTLREAVAAANSDMSSGGAMGECIAGAGADTIVFSLMGDTINLIAGHIGITSSITIEGLGFDNLTISGSHASRILFIDDGSASTLRDVVLRGLTLTAGRSSSNGGAIFSRENLTIIGSVISGSTGHSGGGLSQQDGSLTLIDSMLAVNSAASSGGAFRVLNAPTVTFSNVRVFANEAPGTGGGSISAVGAILIEDTTISGNVARDTSGAGGLSVGGASASAVIRRTTISGNSSRGRAGGLALFARTAIENSTISGNSAEAFGGGIYAVLSPEVLVLNTTIVENSAQSRGGNVYLYDSPLIARNAMIANGSAPNGPDLHVDSGSAPIADYSLIEIPPPGLSGTNNITGVDPQLGPLQNNGGLTKRGNLPTRAWWSIQAIPPSLRRRRWISGAPLESSAPALTWEQSR